MVERNSLPAEMSASATAAKVRAASAGMVRTYSRTLAALVTQLETIGSIGSLGQSVADAVRNTVEAGKTVSARLADVQQQMSNHASTSMVATCREDLAELTCTHLEEQLEGANQQFHRKLHTCQRRGPSPGARDLILRRKLAE